MENVRKVALDRALNILDSLGVLYAVIDENNVKRGSLEVATESPETKRSSMRFPRGELLKYAKPFLAELKTGESVSVPWIKYGADSMQATCCNFMRSTFGASSFISTRNNMTESVEVLRVV